MISNTVVVVFLVGVAWLLLSAVVGTLIGRFIHYGMGGKKDE